MNGYDPNRDAYQAINGFVYQVDLSINDWINLSDDEYLLLEHLEDIDIIKEHCDKSGNISHELTVEQVKHLERVKLTLRRDEVKEAIFNFEEHKSNHSKIKMRLLSNADIGKENKTGFKLNSTPDRVGGLKIWQKIFEGNEKDVTDLDATVSEIRKVIFENPPVKKIKKDGTIKQEWIDFENETSKKTNNEFIDSIIKNIEISGGKPAARDMKLQLVSKLNNGKFASSDNEAEILYNKLFADIFHLVSIKDTSKDSHRKLFTKNKLSEIAKESTDTITEIGNLKIREKLDNVLKTLEDKIAKNHSENIAEHSKTRNELNNRFDNLEKILKGEDIDYSNFDFLSGFEVIPDTIFPELNMYFSAYFNKIKNNAKPPIIIAKTNVNGKSSLFIPYCDNVENFKNKKLWEGWCFILALFSSYQNKLILPEVHSRFNCIGKDIRFLYSKAKVQDILPDIIDDEDNYKEILNSDVIILNLDNDYRFCMSQQMIVKITQSNPLVNQKTHDDKWFANKITDITNGNRQALPQIFHYKIINDKITNNVQTGDLSEIKKQVNLIIEEIIKNGCN